MDILILGNEALKRKAAPVEDLKSNPAYWQETAEGMIGAMRAKKGIGLAGPQVGLLKRIFVVEIEGEQPLVFINPSIVETSQETAKYEEGCLSVPGCWADVVRPREIKVQAWDLRGRSFTVRAEGLLARVIQHEYDHLEGTLFIDHISEVKRDKILGKFKLKAEAVTGADVGPVAP
ncbi:MAG: peptide deformylase [Treponema sp.]|nr:peptide deformylase [Treponema sp.]